MTAQRSELPDVISIFRTEARGRTLFDGSELLVSAAERWLARADANKSPAYAATRRSLLRRWVAPELGGRTLGSLRTADIEDLAWRIVAEPIAASGTRRAAVTMLLVLARELVGIHIPLRPFCRALPKASPSKRKGFAPWELSQLLSSRAVTLRDRVAFALCGLAGLSAGEVRALRWIEVMRGCIIVLRSLPNGSGSDPSGIVSKQTEREIPLHPTLGALLTELSQAAPAQAADFVIARPDGRPPSYDSLSTALRRGLEIASLQPGRTLQDLRWTFIDGLRKGGLPPELRRMVAGNVEDAGSLRLGSVAPGLNAWDRCVAAVAALPVELIAVTEPAPERPPQKRIAGAQLTLFPEGGHSR